MRPAKADVEVWACCNGVSETNSACMRLFPVLQRKQFALVDCVRVCLPSEVFDQRKIIKQTNKDEGDCCVRQPGVLVWFGPSRGGGLPGGGAAVVLVALGLGDVESGVVDDLLPELLQHLPEPVPGHGWRLSGVGGGKEKT